MGPEQTRLMDRLFNDPRRKLLNFSICHGEKRHAAEELCAEINGALDQVDNGTAIRSAYPVDCGVEPIDVRDFVKNIDKA